MRTQPSRYDRHAVRYALFFPPFGALADPRVVAEIAAQAEQAGWDGVFLWDHVLYNRGVVEVSDCFTCLAAVATSTSRVLLGPMVTPLARRRPQVLARQAVALDQLSNGRLVLGLGLGHDFAGELSRFGDETDDRRRAEQLDEGLEVLAGLLSGEEVHHLGPHYRADGVRFLPRPLRPGGIPIWLAAMWPARRPIRRAARHDGLFVIRSGPDDLAAVRQLLEESGARPGFDLCVEGVPGDDPEPWAAAGATWWCCQLGPTGLDPDAVREVVAAGPPRSDRVPVDEVARP